MVLHNPNNWHWVDKNCIQWSREYFGKNLVGIQSEDASVSAVTTKVRSVEGDVDVCQRKGKVISLFDLSIEVAFEGKSGETEVTGRISIPEVAYDTSEDEYQFMISIDSPSGEKDGVKTLVRQKIVPQLRQRLAQFGTDLIETHGTGLQHPDSTATSTVASETSAAPALASEKKVVGHETYNTTNLTLKPAFSASAEQLYRAFTEPELVSAWSRGPPSFEAREGGKFSLFGGNVEGEFVKLVPNKLISQKWRLSSWKQGHYASIDFELLQGDNETTMVVRWEGIPVGQEEIVESNFQNYYVRPIKMTFGYGLP